MFQRPMLVATVTACTVVMSAHAVGSARSAPCPHSLRVWLVQRADPHRSRPVTIAMANAVARTEYAMDWAIATQVVHGRRVLVDSGGQSTFAIGAGRAWGDAYVQGAPVSRTPGPPADALCGTLDFPGRTDGEPRPLIVYDKPVRWDFYVVSYDDGATPVVSPGWTVTPVSGAAMHVIAAEQSGTGVSWGGTALEHFTGTPVVPGGRWGSVAIALIPCTNAAGGVGTGVGEAWLAGGDASPPDSADDRRLRCGHQVFVRGASDRATAYRLRGDVIGCCSVRVRLAVFDLPSPG